MTHHAVLPHTSCDGARQREPVVHTHGSIALLLSGEGVMHMGSTWSLQAGDAFLVPEGAPHYRLDHAPSTYLGLAVCMSCLPEDRWGPPLRSLFAKIGEGGCPVVRPDPVARDELAHVLQALHDERDRPAWVLDARMGVLTALLCRSDAVAADQPPTETPVVARALDWIARNALRQVSLVDVAQAVGRAPSHLATRVKGETGETVGAWITHARMARARELLLRSDDTVDVVAEKVGYRSPSHFHRTFRKVHQLPPARWRDVHRERQPA